METSPVSVAEVKAKKKLPVPVLNRVLVHKIDTGYDAAIVVPSGHVFVKFTEVLFNQQSITAKIEFTLDLPCQGEFPKFSQRVDLLSNSARKSLVADLNATYGGVGSRSVHAEHGINWTVTLSTLFNAVDEYIKRQQTPQVLTGTAYTAPAFLLLPFLQKDSPNLLFAKPEAGKSFFAATLGLSLVTGRPFLGYPCEGGKKVLYIDYEDTPSVFSSRLHMLCKGAGLKFDDIAANFHYYQPVGALSQYAQILKRIIAEGHYDLIIIDAGGDAVGGSPSDEERVLEMFNSLNELPCTKLILHHEPKSVVNDDAAFYGSTYWRARSRVAWRLEVESEDLGAKVLKLTNKKRSNLPFQPTIYYKQMIQDSTLEIFGEHWDGIPACTLERTEYVRQESSEHPIDAITKALKEFGDLTTRQVADAVDMPKATVQYNLDLMERQSQVVKKMSGREFKWSLL